MQLSELAFRQQFERFQKAVFLASKSEFRSFREGLPKSGKATKREFTTEGRKRLAWQSWTKEDVQSGMPIVERTIKAIEIEKTQDLKASNLVDWDSRYGPERKSHKKLIEALGNNVRARAFAEVLFGLYRDELPEAEAFGRFVQLAGRRYDLPAYLFFLKDCDRFMPIAPKSFDKAFELLETDLTTSKHCYAAGIDREGARAGDPHGLDGRQADDRDVEAHVLLRFRDFDDSHAGTGQMRGARDHFIGTFHRLHSHHGPVLHGNRLPNVLGGNRVGHPVSELEIGPLLVGGRAHAEDTRPRQQRLEKDRGIQQLDALGAHHLRDRGDEGIGIARLEAGEDGESVKSGTIPEKMLTCFTWPAMTAWETPAALRILMHFPRCPSDTQ